MLKEYCDEREQSKRLRKNETIKKNGNKVERHLTLPSKIIQAVYVGVKNNISSLHSKKENDGKVGKLKYKSEYNSIELNQYGNTHYIEYFDE